MKRTILLALVVLVSAWQLADTQVTSATLIGVGGIVTPCSVNLSTGAITGCTATSGNVTSVAATGGVETLTGSPITSTGTVRANLLVNAQTGATYSFVDGDRGKLVTFNNASSVAATLAQANSGGNFVSGWWVQTRNLGSSLVTITPTVSTIDGAASKTIAPGTGCLITSDGTNYFSQCGGTTPQGSSLPATCTTGQLYFLTAVNIGLYQCVATNTWVPTSQPPAATGDAETDYYPAGSTATYIGIKAPSAVTASGGIVRYQLPPSAPINSTFVCGVPDAVTFVSICTLAIPQVAGDTSQVNIVEPFFASPASLWAASSGTVLAGVNGTGAIGAHERVTTKSTTPTSGDTSSYGPGSVSLLSIYAIGNAGTWTSWTESAQFWVDDTGAGAMANISAWFGPSRSSAAFAPSNSVQILADTSGAITCSVGGGAYTTTNFVYYTNSGGTSTCADSGVAVQAATQYLLTMTSTTKGSVVFSVLPGGATTTISTNVPTATGYVNTVGVITRTAAQKSIGIAKYTWHMDGLPTI